MKSALQKFRIAIWALMSLVACDSKEPMTSDEAANWVANMKCSFVLIIVCLFQLTVQLIRRFPTVYLPSAAVIPA